MSCDDEYWINRNVKENAALTSQGNITKYI